MLETTRPRHQETFVPGPGGQDDVFDNCGPGGLVTVNHGLHTEQLPVGNMTVGQIRARYTDRRRQFLHLQENLCRRTQGGHAPDQVHDQP